jgi:hypothetical protein
MKMETDVSWRQNSFDLKKPASFKHNNARLGRNPLENWHIKAVKIKLLNARTCSGRSQSFHSQRLFAHGWAMTTSEDPFSVLPAEVVLQIVDLVPIPASLPSVCRTWRRLFATGSPCGSFRLPIHPRDIENINSCSNNNLVD